MHKIKRASRSQLLLYGVFLVLTVFTLRLAYLQIVKHDEYIAQADEMQVSKHTLQPQRGQIYIKDGDNTAPLVLNETVYTVFADPSQVTDVGEVRDLIKKVAGGEVISNSLAKLSDRNLQYIVIAKQVSLKQAEKIRDAELAGIGLQAGTRRVYPEGSLAAQTLGFVNSDGDGQYGIEQYLNTELKGKPGVLQAVTDVRKIPLTIGQHDVRIPATNGENVVLTLDRNIQAQAEEYLKKGLADVNATRGSIVVMNPNNGAIMAMANAPSYSPASYSKVTDASRFQNNVTGDGFEPGSVMKTLTTGAAMDSGAVNRSTTFPNAGCVQVDDAKICNVERSVDGMNMSMTDILQWSLNTGVVWELKQMGGGDINLKARQTLYTYFAGENHYRFGRLTGVEQAGEAPGLIAKPNSPNGARVIYANMTFGQGMNATMLQVASALSAAVNGGTYYKPHIVDSILDDNGKVTSKTKTVVEATNVLKPNISKDLKEMMYTGRHNNGGKDNGYYVGAKSGTAQVYDPKTGAYSKDQYIGTYLGYGADKSHKPKYVIMVRVDDSHVGGTAGSAAAGPIFTNMSNWLVGYLGVSK